MGEIKNVAKNGITVYSYNNPGSHGFFLSLYLRAGNMHEPVEDGGITHFLEHALIRNVNHLMNGELYKALDKAGVVFNASTYSEMVQFYLSGASENLDFASQVLSKLFLPLSLGPSEIGIERERIKAEIREADDKSSLQSFTSATVFEGTSLSGSILGTLGSVSRISGRRLERYRKEVFSSSNLFIYLTGAFSEAQLRQLLDLIGEIDLPKGKKRENEAPVPRNFGKREPVVYVKSGELATVRFNFDMDMSVIWTGADDLIYDILLEGYSSPFFVEMSEKKGLFYDLSGSVEKYCNIGSFSFCFEVRADKVTEAVRQALKILSDFKNTLLEEEDCMKAGYTVNGNLLLDDDRDLNFTFAYDNHILNCSYTTVEERRALYERITPEIIRDGARKIFAPENMVITVKAKKSRLDTQGINNAILDYKNGVI